MIISDLEHLEVVGEENRIEGGVQMVSGSSASQSGLSTTGRVFTSTSTFTSASERPNVIFGFFGPIVVGVIDQTTASANTSGSTSPSFFF